MALSPPLSPSVSLSLPLSGGKSTLVVLVSEPGVDLAESLKVTGLVQTCPGRSGVSSRAGSPERGRLCSDESWDCRIESPVPR